jgi:metal-dependent amidase/aminoacylase/carboxypeptidase family protein
MAAEDNFEIRITGRGGHASAPQHVIDPMVIGAEIVLSLQTIVARNVDPLDSVVVSCTELTTDGARNAIPDQVVIRGDARTFTDADSALVEARIREIAEGAALAHRASSEVIYTRVFRPTINDADCVAHAAAAAETALGADKVDCRLPGRSPPARTSPPMPARSRPASPSSVPARSPKAARHRCTAATSTSTTRSSAPESTSTPRSSPLACPKGIDHDHDHRRLDRQRP